MQVTKLVRPMDLTHNEERLAQSTSAKSRYCHECNKSFTVLYQFALAASKTRVTLCGDCLVRLKNLFIDALH